MRVPRRVCLLLAIIFLPSTFGFGQTPVKEPTASISGHVTVSGKPAPGITIVATMSTSFFDNKTVAKTTTDEDGNYKLTGLTAGRFTVMPMAKAFVVGTGGAYKPADQTVSLADGEAVVKIDFTLVRGGVITGRITDAEGHPIIGERVSVVLKDSKPDDGPRMGMFGGPRNQTDDRGVYRAYGLGPGSYKVSVGQAASAGGAVSIMGIGGSQYIKTFFPGVQEEAKATIIEIKEAAEINNVDITVGKPGGGFSVYGRVIDADSGQPVPNIYIGHSTVNESNQQLGGMNFTGNQTDANGKFRLEGMRPGHYAVFTFAAGQDNSTYSEPALFEISDSDVTGIEIKLRRGATISGVAVLENSSDPAVVALLQTVNLVTSVEAKGGAPSYGTGKIGADGSFRFAGLAPGKAHIFVQGFPTPPKGLTLVRTELDGLDQPEGVELTAGANVTGVRLVFAYGNGSIRGDVKIEGGALPDGTMMSLTLRSAPGNNRRYTRQLEIDARFHFLAENLPPGNYELLVRPVTSDGKDAPGFEPVKQTVTVANGADAQVTLVFDVNAKKVGQ